MENDFNWLALAAIIVGSLTTWIVTISQNNTSTAIAKQQITASVISANRQTWIDSLRNEVSEYIALCDKMKVEYAEAPSDQTGLDAFHKKIVEGSTFYKATELRTRITLRLNPNESDHHKLIDLLYKLKNYFRPMNDFEETKDHVIVLSKKILKEEWKRVKAGN